jgi:hypothetical protein
MKNLLLALMGAIALAGCASGGYKDNFPLLFPKDGVPEGWTVRKWDNVKNAADAGVQWRVTNGVLHGSEPRGTWLVSEREYDDFILEYEWKLGERGNSGCGLRFPVEGDPAFDGLELQMVDPRYFGPDPANAPKPYELSGALYRAVTPRVQAFKPTAWNKYQITCKGPFVKVMLNDQLILDVNLDKETTPTKRHDGTDAPPLKDRPRKGRIGFQELSRSGGHVEIRNARIKELN